MKFDKSRVFTAVNADELRPGDKVILANCLDVLRDKVICGIWWWERIDHIAEDCNGARFVADDKMYYLAYLIERAQNCTNCGEGKWDAEHKKILCDPVHCGNGNVVFRNHETEVCEYWKPKTEQKAEKTPARFVKGLIDGSIERTSDEAEKKYRPFRDTDELIKVWNAKIGIPKCLQTDGALTMPYIWVKDKESGDIELISMFGRGEVYAREYTDLNDLFEDYTFIDGSVCGVEE